MRHLAIALLLAACTAQPPSTTDPDPDPDPDPWSNCTGPGDWCVRAGNTCFAGGFCDKGAAWCTAGACRVFCSAVHWPRCEQGAATLVRQPDGSDICVCE